MTSPDEFAAVVGIDWADHSHAVCLMESGSQSAERAVIAHTPEGLTEWIAQLRQRFGEGKVAICLEQSRGALINGLVSHEFLVLYPVNPRALVNYRRTFATSHAKDDPTDAYLLMDLCLKHREKLNPWWPEDETTRMIRILAEDRRAAVDERTRLTNRLTAVLKQYFPVALDLTGSSLTSSLSCEFLLRWPTLADLKTEDPHAIRAFYRSHRIGQRLIDERLQRMQRAVALTEDRAIIETSVMKAQLIAKQLHELAVAISEYDRKLRRLYFAHPDRELFASFPGAGAALQPRLLAVFGTERTRFADAQEMQNYSGIAPVTERSGRQLWVHVRWGCPTFLRQTFHEFAGQSIRFSPWARAYYQRKRNGGQKHHAAVRALAFKWIRIIYRCWQDRTPYDEARYQRQLQRRLTELSRVTA
jgi:transposase